MLKRSLFSSTFPKSLFSQVLVSSLLVVTVASCSCTDNRKPETEKKETNKEVAALDTLNSTTAVQEAIAEIKSFKGDQVKGKVVFKKVPDGIKIVADVNG
jgi:hypothetical protein